MKIERKYHAVQLHKLQLTIFRIISISFRYIDLKVSGTLEVLIGVVLKLCTNKVATNCTRFHKQVFGNKTENMQNCIGAYKKTFPKTQPLLQKQFIGYTV